MTNWQLLIAAGFPTATGLVTIAIALIMNGRLEARIDRVEASVNGRVDRLEASLNARIDRVEASVDARIDRVETSVNARIDRLTDDLRQFYMILGKHDKSIEMLEKNQAS